MTTALAPKDAVKAALQTARPEYAKALPEGLDIERFERMALNVCTANPKLLECDRSSLLLAFMNAAQAGLEPDPNLGHVYFIPRKGRAYCQVGYRGFLELAMRSERVLSFRAEMVRKGDDFEYAKGTGGYVRHTAKVTTGSAYTHVYAIAKIHIPGTDKTLEEFDVLPVEECERVKKQYSEAFKGGHRSIWETDYEAACKKTVLKRLCKMIPASPRLQRAITIDEESALPEPSTAETIEAALKDVQGEDLTPPPPPGMFEACAPVTNAGQTEEAEIPESTTGNGGGAPAPTPQPHAVHPDLSAIRDLYQKTNKSKNPTKARENAAEALSLASIHDAAEPALEACKLSEAVEVENLGVKECLALIKACGEQVKACVEVPS